MMMTPFFRKLGLTVHITSSVGWLGAVAAFLVLAIAGLSSENNLIVRSSYITMELIGWLIIIPFSLALCLRESCSPWAPPGDCFGIIGLL